MEKIQASPDEIEAFLESRHAEKVSGLEPLAGGFWSSAYAYRVGARDLVLRLGRVREGFEMDRLAGSFSRPDLPVPEVLEIGEAFGGIYALSVRHYGRFLEDASADEAEVVGATLLRLLEALRTVPADPGSPVAWYPEERPLPSRWRGWLLDGLVDDPSKHASGWRDILAKDSELDRLFRSCEGRVRELSQLCPERRDLVHGDLLHQNVLIDEEGTEVRAVFSWKCSVRGDFLFDTAWCTFWSPWHPGIAAARIWERVLGSPTLCAEDRVDAPLRHHCYELQVGASHLGWNAWTGDRESLQAVARHLRHVLDRGPLALPAGQLPV